MRTVQTVEFLDHTTGDRTVKTMQGASEHDRCRFVALLVETRNLKDMRT